MLPGRDSYRMGRENLTPLTSVEAPKIPCRRPRTMVGCVRLGAEGQSSTSKPYPRTKSDHRSCEQG